LLACVALTLARPATAQYRPVKSTLPRWRAEGVQRDVELFHARVSGAGQFDGRHVLAAHRFREGHGV
jgi:hypothetical protein